MNQMNRSSREDAIKSRQQYVKKKAGAATLLVVAVAMTGYFGVSLVVQFTPSGRCLPRPLIWWSLLILTSLTFAGCRMVSFSIGKTKSLTYVPPVHERAVLRAEEILLRGSSEPSASTDELVRAAMFNVTTPETDLLRAADTEGGKTE